MLLKELRLPAFAHHHQALADSARAETWSYTDYLSVLCEREVADRYQRRVQKWTREAQLPAGKTFATLEPSRLGKTVQGQLATLHTAVLGLELTMSFSWVPVDGQTMLPRSWASN